MTKIYLPLSEFDNITYHISNRVVIYLEYFTPFRYHYFIMNSYCIYNIYELCIFLHFNLFSEV